MSQEQESTEDLKERLKELELENKYREFLFEQLRQAEKTYSMQIPDEIIQYTGIKEAFFAQRNGLDQDEWIRTTSIQYLDAKIHELIGTVIKFMLCSAYSEDYEDPDSTYMGRIIADADKQVGKQFQEKNRRKVKPKVAKKSIWEKATKHIPRDLRNNF